MSIYNNKHCVFEQVGVDDDTDYWNAIENKDNDNCYNNWNISTMRNTFLPNRLLRLSNALQSNLTNTTIQTATNGNNGALISTSDKLFLIASKEIGNTSYSRTEENNALITWNYWVNHTSNSDRIKYDPSSNAREYWTRSPNVNSTNSVVKVRNTGSVYYGGAGSGIRVSLCYAF